MSHNGKLIARATARAYASAIAEGADARTAFETACALYRRGHPRIRENILRRVVTALVRHPPLEGQATGKSDWAARSVISAQNAYVRAIAGGAQPHIAFDVARAAYRALYPGLAGAALDAAVAQALARAANRSAPETPEPRTVPVSDVPSALDGADASGGLEALPTVR